MDSEKVLDQKKINVKTEVFEGPLDLLLNLIEKRKLFISDISLAKVAEDYIDFINEQRVFPMSQASHFIYISSTLLLIKSKSLLPNMELTEEEEYDIEDLGNRLKLNKIFKKAGLNVKKNFGKNILFKKKPTPIKPVFTPSENLTIENVCIGAEKVLKELPHISKKQEVNVKKAISLNEFMERLSKKINTSLQLSFKEAGGFGNADKEEILGNFLALLELVRKGRAVVTQHCNFSDISIEPANPGTPQYE